MMVWYRVTRHPRVFRRLTGCQRDPRDRGVTCVGFRRFVTTYTSGLGDSDDKTYLISGRPKA